MAEASQRKYYSEEPQDAEFDLQPLGDEPAHDHGPLAEEPARAPTVWLRRAPAAPRRERASKGWRRHLRKTKALAKPGR